MMLTVTTKETSQAGQPTSSILTFHHLLCDDVRLTPSVAWMPGGSAKPWDVDVELRANVVWRPGAPRGASFCCVLVPQR